MSRTKTWDFAVPSGAVLQVWMGNTMRIAFPEHMTKTMLTWLHAQVDMIEHAARMNESVAAVAPSPPLMRPPGSQQSSKKFKRREPRREPSREGHPKKTLRVQEEDEEIGNVSKGADKPMPSLSPAMAKRVAPVMTKPAYTQPANDEESVPVDESEPTNPANEVPEADTDPEAQPDSDTEQAPSNEPEPGPAIYKHDWEGGRYKIGATCQKCGEVCTGIEELCTIQ